MEPIVDSWRLLEEVEAEGDKKDAPSSSAPAGPASSDQMVPPWRDAPNAEEKQEKRSPPLQAWLVDWTCLFLQFFAQ